MIFNLLFKTVGISSNAWGRAGATLQLLTELNPWQGGQRERRARSSPRPAGAEVASEGRHLRPSSFAQGQSTKSQPQVSGTTPLRILGAAEERGTFSVRAELGRGQAGWPPRSSVPGPLTHSFVDSLIQASIPTLASVGRLHQGSFIKWLPSLSTDEIMSQKSQFSETSETLSLA